MENESPKSRFFVRRRRANVEGGRVHRHDVKVSAGEQGALLLRANAKGISIPRLLVEAALADEAGETPTDRRAVLADLFAAHRKLASMGNNLNQIARATNAGRELPVELQEPLQHTMAAIRQAAARLDEVIDGMPKP